jgi:hypothetical protein
VREAAARAHACPMAAAPSSSDMLFSRCSARSSSALRNSSPTAWHARTEAPTLRSVRLCRPACAPNQATLLVPSPLASAPHTLLPAPTANSNSPYRLGSVLCARLGQALAAFSACWGLQTAGCLPWQVLLCWLARLPGKTDARQQCSIRPIGVPATGDTCVPSTKRH